MYVMYDILPAAAAAAAACDWVRSSTPALPTGNATPLALLLPPLLLLLLILLLLLLLEADAGYGDEYDDDDAAAYGVCTVVNFRFDGAGDESPPLLAEPAELLNILLCC
jgi:hypothetical protein